MNRNKALALNSAASLLQQVVALICGLIVPRLILSTFGSAANGTVASISQFISITSLIQGGISCFTVREGVASVDHTIMYAQYYFSAFLVYPLLYLEQRYGTEKSFMESWLPVAALSLCFRMLNCIVYDAAGVAFFPTLIAAQVRGGHSTSICGS